MEQERWTSHFMNLMEKPKTRMILKKREDGKEEEEEETEGSKEREKITKEELVS